MRVNCQVLFVIAALTCAIAQQPPTRDFILEQNVAIPMRGGVLLRADILRPKGEGPFSVLVYRTPYGKHFAQKEYTIFHRAVQRGYAVVIEDVRGRYASDGEFRPYENEGRDGFDTIEWAAKQAWSNGNVGTFGLSYPGAVQWLAAVESPPHLKAMVPAMTFSTPRNFFYASGTWDNVVDRMDMGQHRSRCARQKKVAGRENGGRSHRRVETGWNENAEHFASESARGSSRRRALLL